MVSMSLLCDPATGDDHPEAASKHLADARVLLPAGRSDGAASLVGDVVECSLKSVILVGGGDVPLIHRLHELSRKALELAAIPGGRTSRYTPRLTAGHPLYDSANGWRETLRYRPEGTVTSSVAASWLAEAQAVYESTIVPMRLDGVA